MLVCLALLGCENPPTPSSTEPSAAKRDTTETAPGAKASPASTPASRTKAVSQPSAPTAARQPHPETAPTARGPASSAGADGQETGGVGDAEARAPTFLGKLAKGEFPEKFAGCGCSVDSYLFAALGEALIYKLNDSIKVVPTRDVHLCFPNLGQLGTTSSATCSVDGLDLKVQMTVTDVCNPEDEGCEYVGADAVVEAQYQGQRQTIRAKGGCGC